MGLWSNGRNLMLIECKDSRFHKNFMGINFSTLLISNIIKWRQSIRYEM